MDILGKTVRHLESELADDFPSTLVATQIPLEKTGSMVIVSRAGGTRDRWGIDMPLITIRAYASTESASYALAEAITEAMLAWPRTSTPAICDVSQSGFALLASDSDETVYQTSFYVVNQG